MLVSEDVSFDQKGASSADQSQGPKGWSTIQGHVSRDSIDTDKYHISIG